MLAALWIAALAAAAAPVKAPGYLRVEVDPRVELMAVLHVLHASAPVNGFALDESAYAAAVERRFGRFRDHPAVREYAQVLRGAKMPGGNDYMLALLHALRCVDRESLAQRDDRDCQGSARVSRLSEFARETGFRRFLREQRPFFDACLAGLRAEMRGRDYAAIHREYTGMAAPGDYVLVPSPLLMRNNYWNDLGPGPRITSVLGPQSISGGRPVFNFPSRRRDIWHEMSHVLLDPLLERHRETVAATEPLFEPVREHCYGGWEKCVKEHVAQGVADRLVAWAGETGRTERQPGSRPKEGLAYLPAVHERLKEFESRRDRYPTLASFYPRLMDLFVELRDAR